MCIADYLARDYLPLKILTKENKVYKLIKNLTFCKGISRRAKYCYRGVSSDTLVVMTGVTWSDDFEPNSMSKSNCGSVWIKILTSILNNFFQIHYKIRILSLLHLKIKIMIKLKKIVEELNELKSNKGNIFYSKALNKNLYVYFKLIACLMDQPERRSINYMVRDGGNFGSRFGYSANINQIKKITIMYKLPE